MLDELWSQGAFLTGNSALTSAFEGIKEQISVSHFALVVFLYIAEVVSLIVED